MKLQLVILVVVLAIASSASDLRGAGINLSWDDCGGYGAQVHPFACDTNVGSHTLVASFVAPAGVDSMTGNEVVMDIMSADPTLPAWWQMRTGLCRASSLNSSFDFTSGPFHCYDYWQGGAAGGIAMDPPGGNRARIRAACALPAGDQRITGVPEGTEVYSFKAIINNLKTTGQGSCAGCATEVCILLNTIKIWQRPPGFDITLTNPETQTIAFWQLPQDPFLCSTPTRTRTWGQIKQLYR